MNFERGRQRDEPEINLIAMIDVLLVILIFMMVTTTFAHHAELKINLPEADAERPQQKPGVINVAVDAMGNYSINNLGISDKSINSLSLALRRAGAGNSDPVVVIIADANATHQSVINVMEASRIVGFNHLTFATQTRRTPQ
jgi:biopolymer transport protein ExbD